MLELPSDHYHRVTPLLGNLPMNTLFARAVVEGRVAGRVYVDDPRDPRACYVANSYGMSLLFGSTTNQFFRASLIRYLTGEAPSRSATEWLQVYPNEWCHILEPMLGRRRTGAGRDASGDASEGRVLLDTRVNFRFDRSRFDPARQSLVLPPDCEIIDDVDAIYAGMRGSVVPAVFWSNAADLREQGAAFGLRYRGELAATAFSAFTSEDALELGVETDERFRGRGFARHACSSLIDHCLERRLEPVWACRLTNVASCRLAERLGFTHLRSLPYYRLPLSADDQ